jgi:predicted permease
VRSRLGITLFGVAAGVGAAWLAVLVSTVALEVCAAEFPVPLPDCFVDDESVVWGWELSVAAAGCAVIVLGLALAWRRRSESAAAVVALGAAVGLSPFVVTVIEFGWPRSW